MKIGVAGTGRMGAAIALRLMDVGHDLTVWNRTPAKTKELAAAGAKVAATPAALVANPATVPTADFAVLTTPAIPARKLAISARTTNVSSLPIGILVGRELTHLDSHEAFVFEEQFARTGFVQIDRATALVAALNWGDHKIASALSSDFLQTANIGWR